MERPETVFEWLARRRNVMVEEMRAYILSHIAKGWNSPDPARRKHAAVLCAGDIPTPEERLRYAVEKIKADGRGDLLYLPDDWEG